MNKTRISFFRNSVLEGITKETTPKIVNISAFCELVILAENRTRKLKKNT